MNKEISDARSVEELDRNFAVTADFGRDDWDSCTVDGCHPNDLGHYLMAKGIAPAVRAALDAANS